MLSSTIAIDTNLLLPWIPSEFGVDLRTFVSDPAGYTLQTRRSPSWCKFWTPAGPSLIRRWKCAPRTYMSRFDPWLNRNLRFETIANLSQWLQKITSNYTGQLRRRSTSFQQTTTACCDWQVADKNFCRRQMSISVYRWLWNVFTGKYLFLKTDRWIISAGWYEAVTELNNKDAKWMEMRNIRKSLLKNNL